MYAHVSGNDVGKAVLVKLFFEGADPEVVMCVLRAPDRILLQEFACATGAHRAQILTEEAVQVLIPPHTFLLVFKPITHSCHLLYSFVAALRRAEHVSCRDCVTPAWQGADTGDSSHACRKERRSWA